MNISINYKYFTDLVHKMEMNYVTNSEAFKSYWAGIEEERANYNKYLSLKYLRNNRGVTGYIPEIKEFKFRGPDYIYYSDIAKQIFMRSLYYCPIDTGALKRSAYVKSDNIRYIDIGYSKDYAMYVHEKLDNFHLRPTRAKFLEDAVMDVCNVNSKLWTLNDISVNVYISYDPLYVRITPKPLFDDMEILFSNYNEVYKRMWNDFDNERHYLNVYSSRYARAAHIKLYFYNKYRDSRLIDTYIQRKYESNEDFYNRIEDYKKGEALADEYDKSLIMAKAYNLGDAISIDGENYIQQISSGLLGYNPDLTGKAEPGYSDYYYSIRFKEKIWRMLPDES